MKNMLVFALLFVLPALIIAAPPANLEEDLFKALDEDSDGKISDAEAVGYFLEFDTDKDASISKKEFATGVDKIDPAFAGHEDALFALLDLNTDGKVTKSELEAVFKKVDTDGDKIIERSEFSKAFATVVSQVG